MVGRDSSVHLLSRREKAVLRHWMCVCVMAGLSLLLCVCLFKASLSLLFFSLFFYYLFLSLAIRNWHLTAHFLSLCGAQLGPVCVCGLGVRAHKATQPSNLMTSVIVDPLEVDHQKSTQWGSNRNIAPG